MLTEKRDKIKRLLYMYGGRVIRKEKPAWYQDERQITSAKALQTLQNVETPFTAIFSSSFYLRYLSTYKLTQLMLLMLMLCIRKTTTNLSREISLSFMKCDARAGAGELE